MQAKYSASTLTTYDLQKRDKNIMFIMGNS